MDVHYAVLEAVDEGGGKDLVKASKSDEVYVMGFKGCEDFGFGTTDATWDRVIPCMNKSFSRILVHNNDCEIHFIKVA